MTLAILGALVRCAAARSRSSPSSCSSCCSDRLRSPRTTSRSACSTTRQNLVGIPPDWISRAAPAPVAYFYDGETYWNGVWQVRFWNSNITDVVSLAPARVPGPMPQRVVAVPPNGRLPIAERYVVASDSHTFAGTPVAHLTQSGLDSGGLTLWRLTGSAAWLTRSSQGIQANGDMTEPGFVRAYDCAGGRLQLTLLPKTTRASSPCASTERSSSARESPACRTGTGRSTCRRHRLRGSVTSRSTARVCSARRGSTFVHR